MNNSDTEFLDVEILISVPLCFVDFRGIDHATHVSK